MTKTYRVLRGELVLSRYFLKGKEHISPLKPLKSDEANMPIYFNPTFTTNDVGVQEFIENSPQYRNGQIILK